MMEKLVQRTFATRNCVHLAHWKTKSYAEHVALGDLYEELISSIDVIVEAYQGIFGLIEVDGCPCECADDIKKQLKDDILFISSNRDKITKKIPALDNLVQELESVYMKAMYKLKNLS